MPKFYDPSVDATDYFLETFRKTGTRGLLRQQPIILPMAHRDEVIFTSDYITAKLPKITKVVANEKNGYTIVKFSNNYVSKVKCNNEKFDLEKAVAMAITKYLVGNNNFYKALENATVIKKEEK